MTRKPNRRQLLQCCAVGAVTALTGCSTRTPLGFWGDSSEKRDDWEYSPPSEGIDVIGWLFGDDGDGAVEDAASENIGLATGGAADVGTFRRNVYEEYLPIPESMAYEGLFGEYYFDTGGDGSCGSLFCPTYTPAVSPDPLSDAAKRYLTVGLDSGVAQSEFERPALNLVIVLDVSGSMSTSFDDYYYDAHGTRREAEGDTTRPKMEVAKEALVELTRHLRPEDRFGVVLFNDDAYLAKPLRAVEKTDMDAIRGHIQEDIEPQGGTNVSAAMELSEELVAEYDDADPGEYETRSLLLTDAQINMGETDADELRSSLEENAGRGHHTTIIGVGVDFNADLISQITEIRGANYYSVYSEDEFERRMDDEFEYMVTPLVYDLSLELDTDGYEIAKVYGSTAADEATGELMHVRTLFPSPRTDGEAKGGVVLVQVERTDDEKASGTEFSLEANWETRHGVRETTTETISFPSGNDEAYGNDAIRKAILLARHADLLKNWTIYEREETLVEDEEGIAHPPDDDRLGQWEQQSDPLTVSDHYKSRFETFRAHFEDEMAAIEDEELEQELELLGAILEAT